ncbi:unnamed protein product [Brachionus calyciflorus]|uniref:Uncharacterized protein n=1 Tax=Brachionus calyciflorus TaxID=104777 RepID=A0A814L404_9BILA|nr:unnamed protein product [Brachionus calyciflorus]CAF1059835.1 unnamed protein product [Brachionus calyciflorus]
MDDRMMATSYRFEKNKGIENSKRSAQEARIALLEDQAREELFITKKNQQAFKAVWNDNFDVLNENFRSQNFNKNLHEDLKIIKKANIMVRRDALKRLYHQDYVLYEAELKKLGLCIHKERI